MYLDVSGAPLFHCAQKKGNTMEQQAIHESDVYKLNVKRWVIDKKKFAK